MTKLSAAENGSGFSLSDESEGGILIHAREAGSFVKITSQGRDQVIAPEVAVNPPNVMDTARVK